MKRFVIAVAVSAASAVASPALATTVASTQFGFSGPRIADPVSVNETFGAAGDPATGAGRADAASLGVRLEVDPFTGGIVDAAIFEELFFFIPSRTLALQRQPATVALSGRLTGTIEEIDPATGQPRPAGESTFGNLQIGVASFRSEAERDAARQRQAAGPDDFFTDLTGDIGGGAGVSFGVTPATSSFFVPFFITGGVCDAVCQDLFFRTNPTSAVPASPALGGVFSLGFTLVASSDGDSFGAATLDALASLEIDGLILLDEAGDPIPAFIFSETRDYTVAAFAPDITPIPLPAAAPLLLAALAALGLLRRARRG